MGRVIARGDMLKHDGHAYVGGGDVPKVEKLPVGMLGADLALDAKAGRWKIARILPGQNWNENRRSPLTEPGFKRLSCQRRMRETWLSSPKRSWIVSIAFSLRM